MKAALGDDYSEAFSAALNTMFTQLGLSLADPLLLPWCQGLAMTTARPDRTNVKAVLLEFAEKDAVPKGCRGAVQRGLSVLMLALDAGWKREQSRGRLCGWRGGVEGNGRN